MQEYDALTEDLIVKAFDMITTAVSMLKFFSVHDLVQRRMCRAATIHVLPETDSCGLAQRRTFPSG